MKAKDLIVELQKLHPDEEIYLYDSEYGPESIEGLFLSEKNGWANSDKVWCIQ